MATKDIIERMRAGGLTRRELNKALASVGLGLATVPVWARRAPAAGKTPVVLEWSGYEIPELHGEYIEKHGGSPDFSLFADEDDALTKIQAGFEADLGHPCTDTVQKYYDAGVLNPIDVSRLKHWADVFPSLQNFEGIHVNGDVYLVPFDWGNSSILYRPDLVDIDEESWGLLFDERYAGKLSMYNSDSAVVVAGLALGYKNIWTMSDEQIAECRKLIEKQVKLVRFYWDDQTEIEQALASGELVAAYAWNSALHTLRKQGVPIKYMVPKEGILTWLCGLVYINRGEGDPDLVYDFIDAFLSPDAGEFMIADYGYGHSNKKSFERVSADTLAGLGFSTDPAEMLSGGMIFSPIPGAIYQKYIEMFEEVKALSGV